MKDLSEIGVIIVNIQSYPLPFKLINKHFYGQVKSVKKNPHMKSCKSKYCLGEYPTNTSRKPLQNVFLFLFWTLLIPICENPVLLLR